MLKFSNILESVKRNYTIIVISSQGHHGWVDLRLDCMKRGVFDKVFETIFIGISKV
jgi:hypothetical protein